jgi:hypothetical protein
MHCSSRTGEVHAHVAVLEVIAGVVVEPPAQMALGIMPSLFLSTKVCRCRYWPGVDGDFEGIAVLSTMEPPFIYIRLS